MCDGAVYKVNQMMIERRIRTGLQMLKDRYIVIPANVGEYASLQIQTMNYDVYRYEVRGVGNLLIMKCIDAGDMQMDSFVLTPYYKNLPLFSTDYIYMKERRCCLNEIYSLVEKEDENYQCYIEKFRQIKESYDHLQNMQVKSCWYDSIRPVCTAKVSGADRDEEILEIFYEHLRSWMQMERETKLLDIQAYDEKCRITKEYSNSLIDQGGVSTDVFKAVLGEESTREFFNSVFFAPDCYERKK